MINKLIERYELLSERQKEEFSRLVKEDEPLGPYFYNVEGDDISSTYHQVLFDDHSEYLYKKESRSPALVIGRRGSGKSTYINNLSQQKVSVLPNKNNLPIILNSWELIREVASRIIELDLLPGAVNPEETARFWELIFLLEIMREIQLNKSVETPDKLKKYIVAFSLAEVASGVGGLVQSITLIWKNKNNTLGKVVTVSSLLNKLMDTAKGFTDIRSDVNEALYELNLAAVILLDNPESPPSKDAMPVVAEFAHNEYYYTDDALSGLLQLCTTINSNAGSYVQIRMCIPSEQYKHYIKRASQPERFGYRHLLHWKTSDLLALAANRILLFGHIYPKYFKDGLYEKLSSLDIYDRTEIKEFFGLILNCTVKNSRSDAYNTRIEEPINYIVRHTQLLPRQIIRYFNAIFSHELELREDFVITDQEIVRKGISSVERQLAKEIARSYEHSYKGSEKIVSVAMKKFPMVFRASQLEVIYKDNILKNKELIDIINNSSAISSVNTKERFVRMLEEMGVIGKVIDTPEEHKYVNVEFEYNIDGDLVTNSETQYSPHPLFSHNIEPSALNKGAHSSVLGIYPKESDSEITI